MRRAVSVVDSERLETRVLLTSTQAADPYSSLVSDTATEFAHAASTFQNAQFDTSLLGDTSTDVASISATSPIGADAAAFDSLYAGFIEDANADIEASLEEAVAEQQQQQSHNPEPDTGETSEQQITGASQSVLLQILGAGTSANSSSQTVTDSADETPTLLQSTASSQALNQLLPALQSGGSLFDIRPVGVDSFSSVNVVTPPAAPGTENVTTSNTSGNDNASSGVVTVTLEQTYENENDWIVHQSWESAGAAGSGPTELDGEIVASATPNADSGDESGEGSESDSVVPGTADDASRPSSTISDIETYSVTVINGTTTVRTWKKGGSVSLRTGSMSTDDSEAEEPWTVPDSWVAASAASVTNNSETDASENDDSLEDADESTPTSTGGNSSGTAFSVAGMVSVTLTEVLVTMADGSPGVQRTLALTWSASVNFGLQGEYSLNAQDLAEGATAEDEPLPDGMTVDVGGSWQLWATASVAGAVTATVTIPDGGLMSLLGTEFDASFELAVAGAAGGTFKSHERLNLDETSGSLADHTDEYDKVHINNSSAASGIVGTEFWIIVTTDDAVSDEETEPEGDPVVDDSTPLESNPDDTEADIVASIVPAGTGATDSSSESEVDRIRTKVAANSGVGTRPAASLTEGQGSGIQFAFEVSGSYESTKDEKFDLKERSSLVSASVVYRSIDQSHSSEIANSSGDVHFVISLGTEQTGIGFSVNVSDSSTTKGDRTFLEVWSPGENPPTEYEVFYGTRRDFSEGESQSSFSFGLALGADAAGDPGDALHSEVEESGFGESDLTLVARVENYLTNAGHVYPYVERTYHRSEGKFRSGIGIEQVHQTGSAELQYSEVGTQSLPDVPPVVLVDVQPGAQDLESLLNEYRDRATKIARWQEQLAETTDPGMRDYLQGLIDSEQSILNTIATNAINAGATQSQLNQINQEAQTGAEQDPIELHFETPNVGLVDSFLLQDGTWVDSILDWSEGGGAIGVNLSGQIGFTPLGIFGVNGQGGVQVLYQPGTMDFGIFGFGGTGAHATGPFWPVAGVTLGGVFTTPMGRLSNYAGSFVGHSGTVGPVSLAYDEGYLNGRPTGVNAYMAGIGWGTPLHYTLAEASYYVGWTLSDGVVGWPIDF